MIRAAAWTGVLALLLMAGSLSVPPPPAPAAAEQDEGCPPDHPRRLPSGSSQGSPYSRALAGVVVCTNEPGTSSFLSNRTAAVWMLEAPTGMVVHRLPASEFTRSFLRMVDSPRPVLPAGATVVVPRSPSSLQLTIEPALTLAQLAHDELGRSLAEGAVEAGGMLDTFERPIRTCLGPIVDGLGPPDRVLASGSPARAIIAAALDVATGDGPCPSAWRSAGGATLAEHVREWRRHPRFAVRSLSAFILYTEMAQPPGLVR